MSDGPPFPLLSLPAGVENILLSFVASGDGGLKHILNLREVCSTTKSWVDRLPQQQGELVFSKAQVKMNSSTFSLKRFLDSAPPFAMTSLSLEFNRNQYYSPEFEELWNRYYAFWSSRLKSLDAFEGGRDFMAIANCPGIRSLRMKYPLCTETSLNLPSALERVSEVSFAFPFSGRESTCRMLMEKLEKNPNLKIFEACLNTTEEFESVRKFIDNRKNNTGLNFTLCITNMFPVEFVQSVVNSKSKFRLKLLRWCRLQSVWNNYLQNVVRRLCEMVEEVENWKPTEDTLSLLNNLPQLKSLRMVDTGAPVVNWDQLAFPPSLEVLGFSRGFPAINRLPESLTSLTLKQYECDIISLLNSLAIFKSRCPNLAMLNITWRINNPEGPILDFETSMGFLKLRSLTFTGALYEQASTEVGREAILNGFNWDKMELQYLKLTFHDCRNYLLTVVKKELLRKICEGPTPKSLLKIEVKNRSVIREGIPLLESLRSCATANKNRRMEKEGKGKWQRVYDPEDLI